MNTHLVFLPATDLADTTYGSIPETVEGWPDAPVHVVQYPHLVWYNRHVQDEAIEQIKAYDAESVIIVGFSKSGLGAWNTARRIPDLITGTIIFDAPVVREERPAWGTAPFYADDAAWQADLPMRTVHEFQDAIPHSHQLVLISGEGFHDEMCQLSKALSRRHLEHTFLPRPNMRHHWNSGWIEEGLQNITERN